MHSVFAFQEIPAHIIIDGVSAGWRRFPQSAATDDHIDLCQADPVSCEKFENVLLPAGKLFTDGSIRGQHFTAVSNRFEYGMVSARKPAHLSRCRAHIDDKQVMFLIDHFFPSL